MAMAFDICRLDNRWCESAFELTTEMSVRHSQLHPAVVAEPSSYRALLGRYFYCDVMDGLSFIAIDPPLKNFIKQYKQLFFVIFGRALIKGMWIARNT